MLWKQLSCWNLILQTGWIQSHPLSCPIPTEEENKRTRPCVRGSFSFLLQVFAACHTAQTRGGSHCPQATVEEQFSTGALEMDCKSSNSGSICDARPFWLALTALIFTLKSHIPGSCLVPGGAGHLAILTPLLSGLWSWLKFSSLYLGDLNNSPFILGDGKEKSECLKHPVPDTQVSIQGLPSAVSPPKGPPPGGSHPHA